MKISEITGVLDSLFPLAYQEPYDNCGLLAGDAAAPCTGALVCLDVTEDVVNEAIHLNANLIIAHHPLIFKGLKKLTGSNAVERTLILAIRQGIAIYAVHTNLDNMLDGVNARIADRLFLVNRRVLQAKGSNLSKLYTFVPTAHADGVRVALFAAGAGKIGDYDQCSFNVQGTGTFRPGQQANPFVGSRGELHREPEERIEVIFPSFLKSRILQSLKDAHPYEEPAFDVVALENGHPEIGSGLIGELQSELSEEEFLQRLRRAFGADVVRHTALLNKPVRKVAVCGGAGSFLTAAAKAAGADVFVTADVKYHEFFDVEGKILLADIGHYESEQFTIDLLLDVLREKFPSFALLKTGINTNPVRYLAG